MVSRPYNSDIKVPINLLPVGNEGEGEVLFTISEIGMEDPFPEDWVEMEQRIRKLSRFKDFESYRIFPIIAKSNDDLRQEVLAMQLITRFKQVFDEQGLSLYLRPYLILVTSDNSGIVGK